MQKVFITGYTYNDIKPDNIMLCNDHNGKVKVTLIDFGFAQKLSDDGSSCAPRQTFVDCFYGNMLFASVNQLNFRRSMPVDDLQSLCYLLLYLLGGGRIPYFD